MDMMGTEEKSDRERSESQPLRPFGQPKALSQYK